MKSVVRALVACVITASLAAAFVLPGNAAQSPAKIPPPKEDPAGRMAQPMPMMTPEQQKRCEELRTEMWKKAYPLREDMWAKQTELNALTGNSKVEPAKISELVGDMKKLRAQLNTLHEEYAAKAKAEGLPCMNRMGMGGMCGMCGGMGGMHGKGGMGGMHGVGMGGMCGGMGGMSGKAGPKGGMDHGKAPGMSHGMDHGNMDHPM